LARIGTRKMFSRTLAADPPCTPHSGVRGVATALPAQSGTFSGSMATMLRYGVGVRTCLFFGEPGCAFGDAQHAAFTLSPGPTQVAFGAHGHSNCHRHPVRYAATA
jgi:hypothetical protein